MKKFFCVAAIIYSSTLTAQQVLLTDTLETNARTLDKVVVTTNKYPKKQSQTGKVVTVIDKEMLEKMGSRTTGEILNTVAGTTINGANNTLGTNQRISIRGAADGNVLLLVNGIPVNDPSVISNYFDLNFIHPSEIERIEVLKGGQSTLYGSDAVAGVINIITKKTINNTVNPFGAISYGSYNTFNGSLGVKGGNEKLNYNISGTTVSSKGFSSAYDSTGSGSFDNDGYKQAILKAEVGFNLTKNVDWNVFANYSRYQADIDAAAFTDDNDFFIRNRNTQGGSSITWKQGNGNLKLNYHYNHVNRYYLDDSTDRGSFSYFSKSNYTGRTHFLEAYESYKWQHIELLAGADYRYNYTDQDFFLVSMFGPYAQPTLKKDARQLSTYSSIVFNNAGWNIEAGGRWNHHSAYGDNFTYTFNPSLLLHRSFKLFGNISSAYKVPSLYQLYDPFAGNTELTPEESRTLEGGIEYFSTGARLRLTAFSRKTDNAIQYIIINPANYEGHYYNTNKQQNHGLEAEMNLHKGNWSANLNYTFTKGKVISSYSESGDKLTTDTTYNNLYRVPEHAANAVISYSPLEGLFLNSVVRYVGERLEPVYAAAPNRLDAYLTLDLGASYRLNNRTRAFIDLKNVTNKQYFDVLGYNSRKFNFSFGLNYQL